MFGKIIERNKKQDFPWIWDHGEWIVEKQPRGISESKN